MMMQRLGRVVVRYRRWVLVGSVAFALLAAVFGTAVTDKLSSGGFDDPGAESTRAEAALNDRLGQGSLNLVLLVTAKKGSVDDPAVAAVGLELTKRLLDEPEVAEAVSYWSFGNAPPLRGTDGRQALVVGRVLGDIDELNHAAARLTPRYERDDDVVSVGVGGTGAILRQITHQAEKDLARAELLTLPVTLVVLLLVFGSAVAAGLPLGVGAFAIVGALLVLRVITLLTDVSIFALNITTALGLGLAVDYSLFIISRYREELAHGRTMEDAVQRTMHTAGRTVAFSAFTVAVSLGALAVFPLPFLRSFAYAGIAVVALAGLGAVILLPAILAVLGNNVEKGVLFRHRTKALTEGFWYRRAHAVMARPVVYAVTGVVVLLLLGVPFLHVKLGSVDDRVLPKSASARQVHDEIRRNFVTREASALSVIAEGGVDVDGQAAEIDDYATRLSRISGVARVDAFTGFYADGQKAAPANFVSGRFARGTATWISVVPSIEPFSPAGERLVHQVRDEPSPFPVLVAGQSAQLVDTKSAITARMPLAFGWIAVSTFVLLFLMVGSLLVPVKALVLNALSLTGTFGALVWIFQDGHLSGLLSFTPTGTIGVQVPILLFCIAFGLSMDYEIFLLSRIKEEYDLRRDNDEAVAVGLEHTGRIVTAAALLISLVFIGLVTAGVTVVKLIGLGLAMAVLVDAFVIRTVLVPAFMRIAGTANWWAPRRLRRMHLRFGIWESEPLALLDRIDDQRAASVNGPAPAKRRERPLRAPGR